jgi:hypothetical protein
MAFTVITSHSLNNVFIVKEQVTKNLCVEINICIKEEI